MTDKCSECDSTETTHYARQGSGQISSHRAFGINSSTSGPQPAYYGPLCDEHAREAGLLPYAFFRDLPAVEVTR